MFLRRDFRPWRRSFLRYFASVFRLLRRRALISSLCAARYLRPPASFFRRYFGSFAYFCLYQSLEDMGRPMRIAPVALAAHAETARGARKCGRLGEERGSGATKARRSR